MKKITHYFGCLLLTVAIGTASYAQDNGYPRPITDKTVGDNLNKDWGQRNPATDNSDVQWYDAGDGYYGTYNTGTTPYIAFYDKEGKYVQSYRKGDWNSVPQTVRSSYDASTYKGQEVTEYWESSDPAKKEYYFQVKDDKGKTSRIWANEKGELSPTYQKNKPTAKKPNQ